MIGARSLVNGVGHRVEQTSTPLTNRIVADCAIAPDHSRSIEDSARSLSLGRIAIVLIGEGACGTWIRAFDHDGGKVGGAQAGGAAEGGNVRQVDVHLAGHGDVAALG
jgi:hypothetical protein